LALQGLLSHLDAVYGLAFVLTGGNVEAAAKLTEESFASVHDDLWTTLGGRSLRDRLLARCIIAYREGAASSSAVRLSTTSRPLLDAPRTLHDLLLGLPWEERAAIALVDQLGLSYADGALVLGTDVRVFRAFLHQGRSTLYAAYGALAR
jgi:DNA-directed RNA polymerase specialized sigma24 family protein